MLRPAWHGEPGWPVLLPTEHLAALRAVAPHRMPPDVIADLVAAIPSRVVEVGDPGVTHDVDTAARRPARLRGAPGSPGRTHPRMGRGCRHRGRSVRLVTRSRVLRVDRGRAPRPRRGRRGGLPLVRAAAAAAARGDGRAGLDRTRDLRRLRRPDHLHAHRRPADDRVDPLPGRQGPVGGIRATGSGHRGARATSSSSCRCRSTSRSSISAPQRRSSRPTRRSSTGSLAATRSVARWRPSSWPAALARPTASCSGPRTPPRT